jgi:hypothetical protein
VKEEIHSFEGRNKYVIAPGSYEMEEIQSVRSVLENCRSCPVPRTSDK